MRYLKQSTAVDVPIGPFVDFTDGGTPETALTLTQPDIRLKKNGAAWAQKNAAQTLSHEENGFYEVTLDTTDTNTLGLLRLAVAESGARIVTEDFMVLSGPVYDGLISGTTTEPTGVPAAGANPFSWISWIGHAFFRNKLTQTGNTTTYYNDAGAAIATATVGDSAGTTTRHEIA